MILWKTFWMHYYHFLVFLTLVLSTTTTLGLLDGGNFVTVEEESIPEVNHSDQLESYKICLKVNLEDLFLSQEENVCPAEVPLRLNPHIEKSGDNPVINEKVPNPIEELKDIKVIETKPKSEEIDSHPPPPLIVKAVPVSPALLIPDENKSADNSNIGLEDVPQFVEIAEAEKFSRKESSVEEEPVQSDHDVASEGEEAVIAPFSQWAEKKLEEQAALKDANKKDSEPEADPNGKIASKPVTNGHVTKSNGIHHKMNKNFASPDCSAKIVGANTGSQGSGNVITTSKDEYFLNKCTDKAWFVVELCESVKVLKVQMANFELYSSSPHMFRVSIGNVFPAREKDWIEFGTFTYEDERSVQTFKNDGVVGKYVKVEILSHHGGEHYCPVSMFKVFGIPEIDLITEDDSEDDRTEDIDETGEDEQKPNTIVQTIKDAVHKVVNVFRPQNVSLVETLNTSSLQGATLRFKLRPEAGEKYDEDVINRYHVIYYLLATQYTQVRQYSRSLGLHTLLPCVCRQFGVQFGEPGVCLAAAGRRPWQLLKFVRAYHGDHFLVALCNLESMEAGASSLVPGPPQPLNTSQPHRAGPGEAGGNRTGAEEQSLATAGDEVQGDTDTSTRPVEETHTAHIKEAPPDSALETDPGATSTKEESVKAPAVDTTVKSSGAAVSPTVQTTWQKLSSKIKALERNVTLSTGFLEELSLKYIKQIEELNTAVKVANDAIAGILKREEVAQDRAVKLTMQVEQLTEDMKSLHGSLVLLQDEILARHGLLLLGEVLFIGLVFLLCRPDGARSAERLASIAATDSRRRSLDTMRDIRDKKVITESSKRRSSIEVGCLQNGQLGSLVQSVDGSGLTKKQRKRRRRKDSKQLVAGLRHVAEELESDASRADSWAEHGHARETSVKTVRFPPSSVRKFSSDPYHKSQPPETSNMYTMLDNSVHDLDSSACDTESEDRRENPRLNLNKVKIVRSKSSSPNRQENLLKKKREAIRKFQPQQVEWLQQQQHRTGVQ